MSSQRTHAVQAPIIPMINQWVRETPNTVSLGQGVAYYHPPQQAFNHLQQQLQTGDCDSYGPVEGLPELQQALTDKLATRNHININDENCVFITAGSNMAFSSLMLAITDPDDEIIILTPYYFNHEMAIKLANARPVCVPTKIDFHPDIELIERNITKKTRAIITVSPNNPTGAVYTETELTDINELCQKHGIYHISDEAYEDFVYEDHEHFSVASLPNAQGHTISLFSMSKAYGFAGWRVGYMVLPQQLFMAMKKVQDTVLISPPIISQLAAIGAHQAPYRFISDKIKVIAQSRQLCLDRLNKSGLLAHKASSEGAFYIFAQLLPTTNDVALAKSLIQEYGVATIPGSAFAAADGTYLRISYGALTSENVEQGMSRLIRGLSELSGFSNYPNM